MKIILQHPHSAGEISGVLACVTSMADELVRQPGVEARVYSSAGATWKDARDASSWADLIQLNSNDWRLLLAAMIHRTKCSQKIHYPMYQTTHWMHVSMPLRKRFLTETKFLVGRRRESGVRYVLESIIRLILRLTVFALVDQRVACSQALSEATDWPSPVLVLPNPLPSEKFSGRQDNQRFKESKEAVPAIAFAGRVTPDKGLDVLIRSAEILKRKGYRFRLEVIGAGESQEEIMQLSKDLGVSSTVHWLGRLTPSDVLDRFANAHTVVVPSRWREPFGLVALEAAAVGTCSIVADTGGLPEAAGPQALVFPPNDAQALADAIAVSLDDPADWIRRGQENRNWAHRTHSSAAIAHHFLALQVPASRKASTS